MRGRSTSLPESGRSPAGIKAANALLSLRAGRIAESLTAPRLLDDARRRTGLDDFGEGDISTPLEMLIDSIHTEANLHPLGYLITRARILGVLANRLISQYWFSRHPQILEQEVDPPIVITGLQRTGTTLLQRMFAADPAIRSVASWEALNPAPPLPRRRDRRSTTENHDGRRSMATLGDDPRVRFARRSQRALRLLAPEFFIIHPVEHDGAEEEILLLDSSLISTVPEALMYVPSFSRWVEQQDQSPAYRRLVMMMKLLQWQERRSNWILKSPHHLEWPDYLSSHLPHARVVMMHRDPVVATSSFFSMVWHGNRLLSDSTSPEPLARHWFRKTRRMIDRFLAFRDGSRSDGHDSLPVVDVSYYELVSDPIGTTRRIYDRFDLPFATDSETRLRGFLRHHRRDQYGVHRYHLESFGISRRESEEAFGAYRERFRIPEERET